VRIVVDDKVVELKENATVSDALRRLRLNPEVFIVSRDNEIVHENEPVRENDELKLIKVISGG
jgi:thiamine biosynthesis protein ThiS